MQIRFASDKLEEGQLETAFSNAHCRMPLAPLAQSVRQALVVSRLEILDVTSTKHFEQHITFVQTKALREDADSKYLDNALKTENEKIYTRLGSFSHRDSPFDPLLTRSGIKGSGLYRPSEVN
jgi:hypothetical protein